MPRLLPLLRHLMHDSLPPIYLLHLFNSLLSLCRSEAENLKSAAAAALQDLLPQLVRVSEAAETRGHMAFTEAAVTRIRRLLA